MLWLAVLVVLCLALLAGILVPLLRPKEPWGVPEMETQLDRLLAEKQRTLRVLKDLDHEHRAGLMDDATHSDARAEYLERAVELNREIASLTGVDPSRMAVEEGAT